MSPELMLDDFESFLTAQDISGAPVLSSEGELLGIASKTDIVRALSERASNAGIELLEPDIRVEDIMSREVVSVAPEAPISQVARIMLDGSFHRVLVTDEKGVLGIITPFDLLRALLPELPDS